MKKKNINKKVVFSIGGLCTLCLVLLAGTWYLNYEPTEEFTPATQEVETLANTWDDKLESDLSKKNLFIPVKYPTILKLSSLKMKADPP